MSQRYRPKEPMAGTTRCAVRIDSSEAVTGEASAAEAEAKRTKAARKRNAERMDILSIVTKVQAFKQTGAEWAQRFKVTRRTITNWLRYPQVQEVIQECKGGTDVTVDRDFVEKLSADERRELSKLLDQQERIENEPGGQYSFEELKNFMVAKAFRADENELGKVLSFLEGMTEVFRTLMEEGPHGEQPFVSAS